MIEKKYCTPSGIVISTVEPNNKDVLWIRPYNDYVEVKLYKKGWNVLFTSSKDKGLSEQSIEQVNQLIEDSENKTSKKLEMLSNRIANNSIVFTRQIDDLKRRVKELEDKINT